MKQTNEQPSLVRDVISISPPYGERHQSAIEAIGNDTIGQFTIEHEKGLTQGISAVTNEVFAVTAIHKQTGDKHPAIVKVGKSGTEPREKPIVYHEGILGGWLTYRLKNEANICQRLSDAGVAVPKILAYKKLPNGTETLLQEKISGTTCHELRHSEMTGQSRELLEKAKGELLASFHDVDVNDLQFGPLSEGSNHFDSWREYFNYRLSTTASLLYGMFDRLSELKYFKSLAGNQNEWHAFLERVIQLYSDETVQHWLDADGQKTLVHGDFWDANMIASQENNRWKVTAIDLERGDVGGKSFDLALWLEWKLNADPSDPNPLDVSYSFLKGYRDAGGQISHDIKKLIPVYNLWQYLDFLLLDTVYNIDRTDESIYEIRKLMKIMEKNVFQNDNQLERVTVSNKNLDFYRHWVLQNNIHESINNKKRSVQEVFDKKSGIVIDGLRLPPAPQFYGFLGYSETEKLLRINIEKLKAVGVDGVVLETTHDRPHRVFYNDTDLLNYYAWLTHVAKDAAGDSIKMGLNFILFDLPGALSVAKVIGIDFVVVDEFLDPVICPKEESYADGDIRFIPQNINGFRTTIHADDVLVFAGTHSNYYTSQTTELLSDAIIRAGNFGADAIVLGKKNANKFTSSIYPSKLPIFIAGGVKLEDLPWIKTAGYNGFVAGSLFEEKMKYIGDIQSREVMNIWQNL